MDELNKEIKNSRLLYRELFLKANDGFTKQLNSLKSPSMCKKCRKCCKIRYSELSPREILALSLEKAPVATAYVNMFIPCGKDESFDYKTDIDLELNNNEAKKIDESYVAEILEKTRKSNYFYYCKYLKDNDCFNNTRSLICSNFPDDVKMILPKNCGFREWQGKALDEIENEISKEILIKLKKIEEYRANFSCKQCGVCCRLASTEYSFEELKEKAKNGDRFATEFVSIFIPYESTEEARAIYPELVDTIFNELGADEKVYFYHCPKIDKNNLCTDYKNRPQICREFPTNPLVIFPKTCEYKIWKDEVHVVSLLMHALIEISEFNAAKIKEALD